MRRIASLTLVLVAFAAVPARATPGGFVFTVNSDTFHPGSRSGPADTLRIPQGSELIYTNLDFNPAGTHTLTSEARRANGTRLFDTPTVDGGEQVSVGGVPALGPGSYNFFCSLHPAMLGRLIVVDT